ncbi:lysophospholipase L2 [Catenovulum agarivorans DS-2]|uniref:Lysophospholipase L2 n=1 Tax=Catenovulum agarivorans DS-2 TaxID=1328313 RepID=W7QRX5_9ALTE|nr:alpha/beta fold hydrolase [Catenovulum agarivorans]EWH11767.1 lysophospholipase L2 [Catenovulum agarivorans DS-2]
MSIRLSEREANWQGFIAQEITPFWQCYHQAIELTTLDGLTQSCATFRHPQAKRNIILLPGRVETYPKYQEVIFDLFNTQANVFVIDHRGQGHSQRMLKSTQKGHVAHFNHYAEDLEQALAYTRFIDNDLPTSVVAHSMGGAIALNWLHLYQPNIDKLVLCAPMLGINAGLLPQKTAFYIACFVDRINRIFKSEPGYFFGQQPYNRPDFSDNVLTGSKVRFDFGQDIQAQCKLGGVTTTWLKEALRLINRLPSQSRFLNCDVLLLQAEKDVVVSLPAQDKWHEYASEFDKNVIKRLVKNARHEILMESDDIRAEVITQIRHFLQG